MDAFNEQAAFQSMSAMMPDGADMFGDGGYDPDSPTNAQFAYFGGDGTGDGQGEDPKRRRIARACDMCRKKKIKCDGGMPCKNCLNYKTDCIFTQVEKKRNPPKGAKYIEGLENRLGRMESLLKLSGLLGSDDEQTDLATLEKKLADKAATSGQVRTETPGKSPGRGESSSSTAASAAVATASRGDTATVEKPAAQMNRRERSRSRSRSPLDRRPGEEEVEALSDMMCSLVTNNLGESRYIGSSSSFSIFSPKGIQWVNEKTGDESFVRFLEQAQEGDQSQVMLDKWKPEVFGDFFGRRQFRPLPPIQETLSLLRDFFDNFNCMFPLFHEPTFMHLVRRQYSPSPYEGTGWWACLNIALAISHRLREMSDVASADEESKAWGFMKNALGVWADLTIKNTDLLSVQALLGMALFLQGTPNPQPPFFIVGAAIRLAHSIGLHKNGAAFGLNPVEAEQRKRVFWIAYILDKDICLRSGRPPAQDDDDMNIDLPSEDPSDNIGNVPHSDGKGKTNMFRLMCTFSIIQSKVYKRLYSARAARKSDGELLNTIGELDKELEEWRESIPPEFRAEHDITVSHGPLVLHIVMLHFSYYNCLTTIHRMSVHNGYWTSRLSDYAIQGLNARPLNPRVFSSSLICMQAARSSVQLVKYIPQSDHACVWMVLYYPVSAAVTLFTNILQSPEDMKARTDLKLIHQVVNFLSALSGDDDTGHVKRVLSVCAEFERLARIVLEKLEKESSNKRRKRAGPTKEAEKRNESTGGAQEESSRKDKRARQSSQDATSPVGSNGRKASSTPNQRSKGATSGSGGGGNTNAANGAKSPDGTSQQVSNGDTGSSHTLQSPQVSEAAAFSNSPIPSTAFSGGNNNSPAPGSVPLGPVFGDPTSGFAGGSIFPDFGAGIGGVNMGAAMPMPGAAAAAMGGDTHMQDYSIPQDVWQMPMTYEWDWAGMPGEQFGPGMETPAGLMHPGGGYPPTNDVPRQ